MERQHIRGMEFLKTQSGQDGGLTDPLGALTIFFTDNFCLDEVVAKRRAKITLGLFEKVHLGNGFDFAYSDGKRSKKITRIVKEAAPPLTNTHAATTPPAAAVVTQPKPAVSVSPKYPDDPFFLARRLLLDMRQLATLGYQKHLLDPHANGMAHERRLFFVADHLANMIERFSEIAQCYAEQTGKWNPQKRQGDVRDHYGLDVLIYVARRTNKRKLVEGTVAFDSKTNRRHVEKFIPRMGSHEKAYGVVSKNAVLTNADVSNADLARAILKSLRQANLITEHIHTALLDALSHLLA